MTQEAIKTSVIIPIYNTEEYLEECIESVLDQTQREIEIILVDDGSTDGSKQIIKRYEDNYACVKAIYQENQKQGAARNAGVKAARGKYIYFLDSDDYISNTLFEECYQKAEKERLDFVMFDATAFADGEDEELEIMASKRSYNRGKLGIEDTVYSGIEFWNRYYFHGGVYQCACLLYINTQFLKRNQLLFQAGIYFEDNDWILRTFLCAQRIAYIPRQLHHRRFRAGSTTTITYNEIHFRSAVVECRKMLDMLLVERDISKQMTIFYLLSEMCVRFREIYEFYYKKKCLENIRPEAIDFYKYLLGSYLDVPVKSKIILFDLAILIEQRLKEFDVEMVLPASDMEEQKRKILRKEFEGCPLNDVGMRVGIYGTGLLCKKYMALYRQLVGEFKADVFFIDSYQKSGERYDGYPLYNLKDVGGLKADCIIILSNRYRDEMCHDIQATLQKETKIMFVPDLLKYF